MAATAGPERGSTGATARGEDIAASIYAEQVNMLYANAPTAVLANTANALILTFILWDVTSSTLLLGWFSAMVILQLGRLALARRYQRTRPRPSGARFAQRPTRWDHRYLVSVVATGSMWGVAGFWLFPQQAGSYQLALIFIIGGTVAGATAVLSPLKHAFALFALPALLPLSVRFFLEGTPQYRAMGILTLIFLTVLLNTARLIHNPIVSSIRLRLENADLVADLTTKSDDLRQINRLLRTEIGQRTTVQEQLQDQLLFLQQLIDAIPNPVFYKDAGGVYRGCNEPLARLFGLSKNSFIGRTVFDMVPRELAEEHTQKDRELLQRGGIQVYESDITAADGTKRRILFHKTVFRDHFDRVAGIIGTLVDLTDRKNIS